MDFIPSSRARLWCHIMSSGEVEPARKAADVGTDAAPITKAWPEGQRVPADADGVSPLMVEQALRLAALGLLLYVAFILLSPFASIIIWSVVLAVAIYPVFDWTSRRLGGRPRLAAVLVTIVSLLLVIGPATWLLLGLIDSVRTIVDHLDLTTLSLPPAPAPVKSWPLVGEPIYQFWVLASTNVSAALAKLAPQLKPLGSSLLGIAGGAGIGFLKFLGAIVVAGFLFPAAPALAERVKKVAGRLVPTRGTELVDLAAATIRNVSQGVIGISALQAVLAGIGLVAFGVPAASLLTSAVLILGIIQVGPTIVLLPLVIWSWTAMETSMALFFTCYMVPVNLLDNLLRPVVMGRGLKTPMPVILLGVLGGTLAGGITGLFLGPIVLAVIWELLASWVAETQPA
jgi:predicted PurR-regulated permease PerM